MVWQSNAGIMQLKKSKTVESASVSKTYFPTPKCPDFFFSFFSSKTNKQTKLIAPWLLKHPSLNRVQCFHLESNQLLNHIFVPFGCLTMFQEGNLQYSNNTMKNTSHYNISSMRAKILILFTFIVPKPGHEVVLNSICETNKVYWDT